MAEEILKQLAPVIVGFKEGEERLRALNKGITKEIFDGMRAAGFLVEGRVKHNIRGTFKGSAIRRPKGKLLQSWTSATFERGGALVTAVGSSLIYAKIQEEGGTVVPRNKKFLAVPLTPAAAKARPLDFHDTYLIPSKSGFVIRQAGSDENLYALVKSVKIPARPYVAPAQRDTQAKVLKLVGGRVEILVRRIYD